MKLETMRNVVTSKAARSLLLGKKHSPTILFAGGVVGFVSTTVLAAKATLRLEEVLDDIDEKKELARDLRENRGDQYSEADYKKDLVYLYSQTVVRITKLYGPTIIVGSLSIAALTGSHTILSRRNAGLTAAYAALDKGFREYRARVVDELGEDKDREFRFGSETREVVTDTKNGPKKTTVKHVAADSNSIYARFFTQSNENWNPQPEYNWLFLRTQQKWANQRLRAKGHLFLNEVYDDLGIERSPEGNLVGWIWNGDGDNYVDFGIFNEEAAERVHDFMVGREQEILLDFNVDGTILDKI